MNYKKILIITIILFELIGLSKLQAQEAIISTGGETSGSGGSSSYTIGQVVYTTHTGTNNNSIAEGVQQPYEISIVTGIPEANGINILFSAYPNPTTDCLIIRVNNYESKNLQYHFFDINGKLLQIVKATGQETQIQIGQFTPANYFVKILENNKEIKVFKIIKN